MASPGKRCPSHVTPPLLRLGDYVDALGEPIDEGILRAMGIVISRPEEVWGVEVSHIAQSLIPQARRFREWAFSHHHHDNQEKHHL